MTLRNPNTGEAAMEITVWYEASGSSPKKPYTVDRWKERRMVKVPGHLIKDTEQWSIDTANSNSTDPA